MSKTKNLTLDEVKHVAKLADLPLTDEELKVFQGQLSETIDYINDLKKLPTKNISPTSQVTGKVNQFREDITNPCLTQEAALKNGRRTYNGFFVSKISWS